MYHPDDPSSPGERARRRRLFSSEPSSSPTERDVVGYVEEMMAAYQATIQRQLDEGLSALRHTANALMHEVASEVWRTARGDKNEVRERIVHELSRDQAIHSLIAQSDERFEALAVRTARLEDTLNLVADSVREAKAQLAESIGRYGAPDAPGDTTAVRAQLADITRQVAGALQTLAERDQEVIEAVRSRILEHGQLITQETTRISGAMESYVQHGVEAIGQLAGTMEAQVHALATRDEAIAERIGEAIERQMTMLGEQLQLMYERMAIDTTSITEAVTHQGEREAERAKALGEYVNLVNERIDVARRDVVDEMNRAFSDRVMGLARMVRSDAEVLRRELVRTAEAHDERIAAVLDERLARVSTELDAGATRMAEELIRRIGEEQARLIDGRMGEAVATIDGRMGEAVATIDARMGDTIATIHGRMDENARRIDERVGEAVAAIDGRVGEAVAAIDGQLAEKMAALARLVRSDNETLAEQIAAGQDATKRTLRAMKELQANLPSDVVEMIEQRVASLAETIERSNETLAKRIDKISETIGKRHDNDIQIVIDRMGDAMHALASLGRGDSAEELPRTERRIELE